MFVMQNNKKYAQFRDWETDTRSIFFAGIEKTQFVKIIINIHSMIMDYDCAPDVYPFVNLYKRGTKEGALIPG